MADPPDFFFADQPWSLTGFASRLIAWASLEPVPPAGAPIGEHGGAQQRGRIALAAEWACRTWPGDLAEIGVYSAETTVLLAEVARRHGRRVLALDSWPPGTPYDLAEKIMPIAYERLAPYRDVVDVVRAAAEGPEARAAIQARRLAMAFIDADKVHEHVRAQISAVLPVCSGPVAIDDAYSIDVLRAADEMARETPHWRHLRFSGTRETWLLPEDATR